MGPIDSEEAEVRTSMLASRCAVALLASTFFVATAPQAQILCPMECPCGLLPQPLVAFGGLRDDFVLPAEPANPDVELATLVTTCSGQPAVQYDEIPGEGDIASNRWFAETIGDLFFICDGRLEIHVRATTGTGSMGTSDDRLSLQPQGMPCTPNYVWSEAFANLPESGGTWNPGQEATFCLDLDDLPASGGETNVLYYMTSGTLRIAVDDDTGVDSIVLSRCDHPEAVHPALWGGVKALYRE